MTTQHTHTAKILPYDGHNPNNCDCCGIQSASWSFTPLDIFNKTLNLCATCRTTSVQGMSDAYQLYNITPDLFKSNIEKLCWYNNNY